MVDEAVMLRTDGGARGNPGPAGIGFEYNDGLNSFSAGAFIGETTNNVAEYKALIWGLENALKKTTGHIHVQADSQLMIRQLTGQYKVRAVDLKPLYEQVRALLAQFENVILTHIPRELNKVADMRANEAMDVQHMVGEYIVPFEGDEGQLSFESMIESAAAQRAEGTTEIATTPRQAKVGTSLNGTYSLTVKDHFDAAHNLYDYPGECRNLHGHTWDVEVTVTSRDLDKLGLVCDFKDLKVALREVLNRYDHTYINERAPFDKLSPTAENLAREICMHLTEALPSNVKVKEVAVWESPIARVGFTPED